MTTPAATDRSSALPSPQPEPWLRGPIEGVDALLMPVAHALAQAREDLARTAAPLTPAELWTRPAGAAASVGFHLRHIAGSIDRLLTYAAARQLDEGQRAALAAEMVPGDPPAAALELLAAANAALDEVMRVIRSIPSAALLEPRDVGRARLPSTVLGLLFHIAEHTQRHVGQVVTTSRIVRAPGAARLP